MSASPIILTNSTYTRESILLYRENGEFASIVVKYFCDATREEI